MSPRARFAMFIAIGGFASLVNLVARILFGQIVSYSWSIVLAFPIALLTAFALNRRLVFAPSTIPPSQQLFRFLLVNLAALVQILAISLLFARVVFPAIGLTWNAETLAHGIGLLSPIATSYWAHKHFTFAAPKAEQAR